MTKFVDEPSFCFISPIEYLNYLDDNDLLTTSHLSLAHLVDASPEYAQFYSERGVEGDFIIMDNSAYELKEPYSPSKLLELARISGASAIVLPDYPFQHSQKTIDAAEQWIPTFKSEGFKTMFVPQSTSGSLEEWIDCYVWAANNPHIDILAMSILGIPNALPDVDPSYARVVMTSILQDRALFNHDKHHHYLGLNAGPRLEIPTLLRMDALDTIDSSGPIWSAILGHEYTLNADSLLSVSKPKMPVAFDVPMTKDEDTLARIECNINLTNQLFEDLAIGSWYAEE